MTDASTLHGKLLDSLYAESMLLADEARAYFDMAGRSDRDALDPYGRVAFSCESLRVTTRLMHVIAWLLTQRAVQVGELTPEQAIEPTRRLGPAIVCDAAAVAALPGAARSLVLASAGLYGRVAKLDTAMVASAASSPARAMQARLAAAW